MDNVRAWFSNTRNRGIAAAIIAVVVIAVGARYVMHAPVQVSKAQILSIASTSLMAAPTAIISSSTPVETAASTSGPETVQPQVAAPSISTTTVQAQELAGAGTNLLHSLVNIVCLSADPQIPSISGSGIIIDSRGIIVTAAHVAQLFLLQDYLGTKQVECIVRTGSPARRAYLAEPIYVSPEWVNNNPNTLKTTAPTGTGEDDFALIGITATATSTPLPSSFPATPLASDDPQSGEQVAIASYGAEYLTGTQLNYDLYPILVFGSIQDLYTFVSNTVDLFSVVGSAASQEGSSGGGMANAQDQLLGIITTSSVSGSISTRSLNAITVGYIRRSYESDTGQNLDSTLSSNSVPQLITNFNAQSKQLGAFLAQQLNVHS